jgi:hypothetical protein
VVAIDVPIKYSICWQVVLLLPSNLVDSNVQEEGVFEAIDNGYLESLQIFVTQKSDSEQTVIESYKFQFNYASSGIRSVKISPGSNRVFILEDVHRSFKSAIRALLRSLKGLPRLSGSRSLTAPHSSMADVSYSTPQIRNETDLHRGMPDHVSACRVCGPG